MPHTGHALARHHDPIVAIATAPGRGAVGIVRASGRDLAPLIHAVCGRPLAPRQATLLPFCAADGSVLDTGLAVHFPAPHSYTGEDVLELQAHGGAVLLQLLLARCIEALPGLRLAEPGEFTQRAYLNDKLDLAQAEAVADLIDASTEAAARSAARSLAGEFSAAVNALAADAIGLRTLVEATLDFPEEEIEFLERAGARARLAALVTALDRALAGARQGALLREGLHVVLAGQPNVGKSSLLNALAGAELAIVTPIPGTTRDRISETIQIEGVPLRISDTAGLRDLGPPHEPQDAAMLQEPGQGHADEVERIGIARSWGAIGEADVLLFLHDLARRGEAAYEAADVAIAARLPVGVALLHVFNKADLVPERDHPTGGLALSAKTGAGLAGLRAALLQHVGWQPAAEGLAMARKRHVLALQSARAHLLAAQAHADAGDRALDLVAEELRLAHAELGSITGAFDTEALLGEIFGRFCIGK
jgi:tRNA modification GTPase